MQTSFPFDPEDLARAEAIIRNAGARGWRIATAESCTGGLVAALLTEVAGSSAVFDRGFVTYANEAKIELIGVAPAMLAEHGAVSAETAEAMARGALERSLAHCAISITGIAGPGGGSDAKPVGLVHFGLAVVGRPTVLARRDFGAIGRRPVRQAAVRQALAMIEDALESSTDSAQVVL